MEKFKLFKNKDILHYTKILYNTNIETLRGANYNFLLTCNFYSLLQFYYLVIYAGRYFTYVQVYSEVSFPL